jgi:acetamidase/formamidase
MITPEFEGGHEVTEPVAVQGAEAGDGVALHIKRVRVTSEATASGTMTFVEGRYQGDPFVARVCPECGTKNPPTKIVGIGQGSVHCAKCGAEVSPFRVSSGYTIVLDPTRSISVTVGSEIAEQLALEASQRSCLPEGSEQHSILVFNLSDIPGIVSRMRPFLGNIGTTPSIDMPDSHNSGDFGTFLLGAPHEFALTEEQLDQHRTDSHLDVDSVREGAILICPVKVPYAGVFMGDMHAQQGDGEVAGHTTDVAGEAEVQVEVIKGLGNDGPILIPPAEDLPHLARPLTKSEWESATSLAARYGQHALEESAPIQVIGSGGNLNAATDNGLARMAKLADMSIEEAQNRVTLTGAVEIGRLPGLVTVTMAVPMARLQALGIDHLVRKQYGRQP